MLETLRGFPSPAEENNARGQGVQHLDQSSQIKARRKSGEPALLSAWRAALEFAEADQVVAIAGTPSPDLPARTMSVTRTDRPVRGRDGAALIAHARRHLFAETHGDETILLDTRQIATLVERTGFGWLQPFNELAIRRLEGDGGFRFVAVYFRTIATPLPFLKSAIERATDILAQFARSQLRLEQRDRQHHWSQMALDSLSLPILIVDKEAAVLHANAAAKDLLRSSACLFVEHRGRLGTVRTATKRLLRDAIAMKNPKVKDHLCSLRDGANGRLILAIRCMPIEEGGGAVIVAYPDFGKRSSQTPAGMFEAAGLIKSEARFLQALGRHGTVADAARSLDLSEATGRTYTKRILSKLGLRNQLELGHYVGSLEPPFRSFGRTIKAGVVV
jgi:PAS domain-containing protein/DNA-binding CsgD family transcriptional regulator